MFGFIISPREFEYVTSLSQLNAEKRLSEKMKN